MGVFCFHRLSVCVCVIDRKYCTILGHTIVNKKKSTGENHGTERREKRHHQPTNQPDIRNWNDFGVAIKQNVAVRTKPIKFASRYNVTPLQLQCHFFLLSRTLAIKKCCWIVYFIFEASVYVLDGGRMDSIHHTTPIDWIVQNVDRINHEYRMHFLRDIVSSEWKQKQTSRKE